jgi:hypothetical protein
MKIAVYTNMVPSKSPFLIYYILFAYYAEMIIPQLWPLTIWREKEKARTWGGGRRRW